MHPHHPWSQFPRIPRVVGVLGLLAACAQTTGDTTTGGSPGPTTNAGVATMIDGTTSPDGTDGTDGGATHSGGTGTVCAGTTCAPSADCCLVTGRCFNRSHPGDCVIPPADAGVTISVGAPGARPCGANSQCAPTEYCAVHARYYQGCLGVGVCESRANAGTCSPAGSTDCEVCGCDGVSYASQGAAQRAGVNYHSGPCGVSVSIPDAGPDGSTIVFHAPCGGASACPGGETCCGITGQCYDPACPGCCRMPPPGTAAPCGTNADCPSNAPFCMGGPACDAPGFCIPPTGHCTGAVLPVCGCDGVTYLNACQAQEALVRIVHTGSC